MRIPCAPEPRFLTPQTKSGVCARRVEAWVKDYILLCILCLRPTASEVLRGGSSEGKLTYFPHFHSWNSVVASHYAFQLDAQSRRNR